MVSGEVCEELADDGDGRGDDGVVHGDLGPADEIGLAEERVGGESGAVEGFEFQSHEDEEAVMPAVSS